MENVISLDELEIGKGKVLLKVVEKKSKIILQGQDSKDSLFSHYEVIRLNGVDNIKVKEGDIVVAASGIGSNGGFMYKDDLYMVVNGFNLDIVTDPSNFKFN